MTPKEKADNLFKKHLTAIAEETMDSDKIMKYNALQCAFITAEEVYKALPDKTCYEHELLGYWKDVIREIGKQIREL